MMKIALIVFVCVAAALANPDGAPTAVCFTMLPNHGTLPQTSPAPVRIVPSSTNIQPGQTITITVESINPGFQWRGFMLQPRNVVAPNPPLGTILPGAGYQVLTCQGGSNSATHVANTLRNTQSVQWTAPQFTGGVQVHLTVVQGIAEGFWFQITSPIINVSPAN